MIQEKKETVGCQPNKKTSWLFWRTNKFENCEKSTVNDGFGIEAPLKLEHNGTIPRFDSQKTYFKYKVIG